MPAGTLVQSGSLCSTAPRMSATDSPGNAGLPERSSYATTPNAQMSALWSAAFPRACSGAMYAAVPRIIPAPVSMAGLVTVSASEKSG